MNATGHKGVAKGFKITSINKLVDTKSATSTDRTLLHFTAKTVSQSMPQVEAFLEELEQPSEAYKCASSSAPFSSRTPLILALSQPTSRTSDRKSTV